ncbi:J domain-containing protein [Thioalkalivibrio sulfidiphilus]|uniref:J domain-containing protein n=1 Tax=Thioalkalivibrio sulfidiphilus TaxID=1033854 RepID=UPI0003827423|nr:J domain-containing protein [Thioalkalivibrio sulfidiphilus]
MQGKQGRLFDDLPVPEDVRELVRISGHNKQLDPEQRTFNRLSGQVRQLQEDVALWQEQISRLAQRVHAEMLPRIERLHLAQRMVVFRLDELLNLPKGGLRLSKTKRGVLSDYICMITETFPDRDQDPELVALCERHTGLSREEEAALERELAREFLGAVFGEGALDGYEGDDLTDMIDHAANSRAQGQGTPPPGRRPKKKERALLEAKEAADAALRETYRKLASFLHPDREQDPEERVRKTELMQQVNEAFEKRDLIGLLRLQMACSQLDVDTLGGLPEARIKRFNKALREQVQTLKKEKEGLIQAAADLLDVHRSVVQTMRKLDLDALFDRQVEELQASIDALQGLHEDLNTPSRRDRAVRDILTEMDGMMDFPELDMLFDSWAPPEYEAPKPRGRGKRKTKR